MARARLADAIVKTLKSEQVDVVFGICGGYLFWLLRALDEGGVRTIPSRHEGAAAFAAAAYAQASGRIGVVFGQGPGATNALTGVACAYYDSTPLLAIASQAPQALYAADSHQEATGSNFGIDQLAVFKAVTRASFRCASTGSSIRTLRRALAIAQGDRGPTMIEFPANMLSEEFDSDDLEPSQYRGATPQRVDNAAIAEAADLIAGAARPMIVIGNRATHRGLSEDLRGLCEDAGIAFATSDFAKGIISEDHPHCTGIMGWCGHDSTHEALQAADVVITIGVRLDSKATLNYQQSFFKNLVQIDEEPSEIGRNFPVRVSMLGDIPATVRALRDALRARGPHNRRPAPWVAEVREKHHTYREPLALEKKDELGSARVMQVLRETLPRKVLVTGDSGLNLHYLKRFFPIYEPDGFFCFYGWAAMGSGLPVAIGVQAARPDSVVVCVIGDGGLLVHAGELQILAEYNLPIIVVVLNNAGYQQVGAYMSKFIGSSYGCPIQEIDAAKIAESFGCDGYTARTATEVASTVQMALEKRRPAVIDIKVKGDQLEDIMLPSVDQFVRKVYAPKQS